MTRLLPVVITCVNPVYSGTSCSTSPFCLFNNNPLDAALIPSHPTRKSPSALRPPLKLAITLSSASSIPDRAQPSRTSISLSISNCFSARLTVVRFTPAAGWLYFCESVAGRGELPRMVPVEVMSRKWVRGVVEERRGVERFMRERTFRLLVVGRGGNQLFVT